LYILKGTFIKKRDVIYKIDYIKKTKHGVVLYCKDVLTGVVFALNPDEVLHKQPDKLELFETQDKIRIITLALSNKQCDMQINLITSNNSLFPILAMFFSSCLLISNIIAQKLVPFMSFTITASDVIYPLTFLLGGIISDIYGYRKMRQVIWFSVIINLVSVFWYKIAIILPVSPYWSNQDALTKILDGSTRVIVASVISYVSSEFLNSYIVSKTKIFVKGHFIWLRLILGTIIGITVDNYFYMFLAYYKTMPTFELLKSANFEYIYSIFFEIFCSPIFFVLSTKIKKFDKMDILDIDTKYTPFSLEANYGIHNNMYQYKP
jgi:uncharacterized integral membrane protein (TIGR00697 family)